MTEREERVLMGLLYQSCIDDVVIICMPVVGIIIVIVLVIVGGNSLLKYKDMCWITGCIGNLLSLQQDSNISFSVRVT